MKYINPSLNIAEKDIIVNKWTERPYSWAYTDHKKNWTYICKNCWAWLYHSSKKFDSGCGWPSFESEIPWSVTRKADTDGIRTEITCASCEWHLWHVFVWEQETTSNARHCVNSISLKFVDKIIEENPHHKTITLWWWCFWCIDGAFADISGIIQRRVWYSWWKRPFPTYAQICTWASGHHEVVQITYDDTIISLDRILELFFKIHDPTSQDRQGNDKGTQYRSVIFVHDKHDLLYIQKFVSELEDEYEEAMVTEIKMLVKFWIAEGYHQDYFKNNPEKPYCQLVIAPKKAKVDKILENFE